MKDIVFTGGIEGTLFWVIFSGLFFIIGQAVMLAGKCRRPFSYRVIQAGQDIGRLIKFIILLEIIGMLGVMFDVTAYMEAVEFYGNVWWGAFILGLLMFGILIALILWWVYKTSLKTDVKNITILKVVVVLSTYVLVFVLANSEDSIRLLREFLWVFIPAGSVAMIFFFGVLRKMVDR